MFSFWEKGMKTLYQPVMNKPGSLTNDTEFGSLSPDWTADAFPDLAGMSSASTQPPRFSPALFRQPLGDESGDEGAAEAAAEAQAARDLPPACFDTEVDVCPLPPLFLEVPHMPIY